MGKEKTTRKRVPARTAKARENQLINLAIDLAERQLRDGSATSQVITHFLKLATVREQLENEKLRTDLRVSEAKIKQMESQTSSEELFEKAINALKSYNGNNQEEEEFYDD